MIINIKQFGDLLVSRPAGREAFLSATAYMLPSLPSDEEIIIDFEGVNVLTPSWADEFITPIKDKYKANRISFLHDENPSVKQTLNIINQ